MLLCVNCGAAADGLPSGVTRVAVSRDHDRSALASALLYSRCVGFTAEQNMQSSFSTRTLGVSQLLE